MAYYIVTTFFQQHLLAFRNPTLIPITTNCTAARTRNNEDFLDLTEIFGRISNWSAELYRDC